MPIIRTPAGGDEVRARLDGVWYIEDLDGRLLGALRPSAHGSRKVWSWSTNAQANWYDQQAWHGRYVDRAHAVQGLLAARQKDADA